MKADRQMKLAAGAVCLYIGWQARDLPDAWLHSPFDHLGVLAFALWVAPLGFAVASGRAHPGAALLCTALAISLVGVVLDLNFLNNAGLAVSLASFFPARPRPAPRGLWLAGALSWMPALGWVLNSQGPLFVSVFRMAAALGMTFYLCRGEQRVQAV